MMTAELSFFVVWYLIFLDVSVSASENAIVSSWGESALGHGALLENRLFTGGLTDLPNKQLLPGLVNVNKKRTGKIQHAING